MSKKLPVLSVKQPYAYLIVNGYKDIENRKWPTNYRGQVLIHASKTQVANEFGEPSIKENIKKRFGIDIPENLETGGIVGSVEIIRCVQKSLSPWFTGPYGFVLKQAKTLPFQPCKGKLGFFHLKEEEEYDIQ